MKQLNLKKLVLLNLPYFLLGLFATNLGEAWRLATGADASAKMLSFFSTLPVALGSWWPSLHPLDLAVGLCCGAGLRLAVYLKGKNAKKYRHNVEYGSARWGTHDDIRVSTSCCARFRRMTSTMPSAFGMGTLPANVRWSTIWQTMHERKIPLPGWPANIAAETAQSCCSPVPEAP